MFAEPPALLSRTVNRKFNVLANPESASEGIYNPGVVVKPAKTVVIVGKYRVEEITGGKDLKSGPTVFVALGTVLAASPKSISSQLYVNISSVFASVADPVSIKGVPFGML